MKTADDRCLEKCNDYVDTDKYRDTAQIFLNVRQKLDSLPFANCRYSVKGILLQLEKILSNAVR